VKLRTFSEIKDEADSALLAEIMRGLTSGMTQAQVAEAMAVHPSTLCRFLQSKGYRVLRVIVEREDQL